MHEEIDYGTGVECTMFLFCGMLDRHLVRAMGLLASTDFCVVLLATTEYEKVVWLWAATRLEEDAWICAALLEQ